MSKKKFTESFGSKGYYIALILCAAAIGVSGYLYYRNETSNKDVDPGQSALSTEPVSGDVQAVATQPLDTQGQTTSPSDSTTATEPAKKPGKRKKELTPEEQLQNARNLIRNLTACVLGLAGALILSALILFSVMAQEASTSQQPMSRNYTTGTSEVP